MRNPLKVTTTLLLALTLFAGCGQKPTATSPASGAQTATVPDSSKVILFFGDSLTAGYGLDDESEAFPGIIAKKIDSLKLPYRVVNAGVSGETSAGGLARADWILKQKVDLFLLELGANDGLRGNAVQATRNNLQAIIDKVKAKYPAAIIILLGMQVPPSMGPTYTNDFKKIYPELAAKNQTLLVPFLLQNVGGVPQLNQADGIHPNATGAKIVANNVWQVLKPELK